MKLLNNPFPLALLGTDVLGAGYPRMWNFMGIEFADDGKSGVMKFKQG